MLSCCTFCFIYLFLPETAGLSLENVAMVYDPARAPIVYPRAARECLDPLFPCLRRASTLTLTLTLNPDPDQEVVDAIPSEQAREIATENLIKGKKVRLAL